MRTYWRFGTAGDIVFGSGTASSIGREAHKLGGTQACIVTDANMIKAGLVATITDALHAADISTFIFEGCKPEPSTLIIDEAVVQAKSQSPEPPNIVIGLGGGSNLDVAKGVAAVLTHGGQAADYFGEGKLPGPTLPLIAVPTTAGTGSEVSAVAIIEDPVKQLKLAISSPHLRPRLALIDPQLTVSCPPKVTAESGIDALTHAIEAYTNIDFRALPIPNDQPAPFSGKQPLTDALAAEAIQLVGAHLRTAVYQPTNLLAREGMSLAALLGGMAFSNAGVGSVHALQYPIGAVTHTSHGLGNGLMLPYLMNYLIPSNPQAFANIAAWLGEQVAGLSVLEAAYRSVDAVQRLKADIGIPARLSDIGIEDKHLAQIAQTAASNQRLMPLSPRTVNAQILESILRSAL